MAGQQTLQSTISRNNSQLTVKPLNAWNFSKFKPHQVQKDDYEPTKEIFKDGFPDHQAMFYDGSKSILACGFIDISGGQYYAWTLFGSNFKKIHYRFFINYSNNYLAMLQYTSIHHLIRKDMPWTRKMIAMMGFKYVREEDENLEHWVRT